VETLKGVAQPAFELAYNGKASPPPASRPYVLAITYTDHLTGESDELDVELEDTAGAGWMPGIPRRVPTHPVLRFLGTAAGQGGRLQRRRDRIVRAAFRVRMRGLATGVQDAVRTRKGRAYEKTTLAAIAQRIAKRHKMKLIGKVEALQIDRATQYHESDLQFLARLAGEYGYAFKVTENNTKMVFWKTARPQPAEADPHLPAERHDELAGCRQGHRRSRRCPGEVPRS
jgi:phage protein D